MKETRYSEEQIIGALKQMGAGRKVADLARELGVSEATTYTWKSKFGGLEVSEARAAQGTRRREPAAEAHGRRPPLGQRGAEIGDPKKRLELVGQRKNAAHVIAEFGMTERQACKLLDLDRTSYHYQPKPERDAELRAELIALARQKPRYGYRRLHVLLARRGWLVNHKRLYRLYRQEHLAVRRLRRKRLARPSAPIAQLNRVNQERSMDFVMDGLATGRALRVLTVVDSFTRECLAMEVDSCLSSRRATRALEWIIQQRGTPEAVRCDNGPEFTSRHFLAWCENRKIGLIHIQPGRPMQNGRVESFNGRLRDECLNATWFQTIACVKEKIESWREEYNGERPHSSLGYMTPLEFARGAPSPS
jgi:putative transposase